MGRKRERIRNTHFINEIRITTSASSMENTPIVLIFKIDFDFTGKTDKEEYEMFQNNLYDIFFKAYPQRKKILTINLPEYDARTTFNKKKHHCGVEVYQLNTQNLLFDEFESIVLTDFMELFPQIKRLFKDFSFKIEQSKKRVKKDLVF